MLIFSLNFFIILIIHYLILLKLFYFYKFLRIDMLILMTQYLLKLFKSLFNNF